MLNYLNKFSLKNKIAYVVGGLGLVGQEVSAAFTSAGAETIILDNNKKKAKEFINKINNKGYNLKYKYFNCEKVSNLNKDFSKILNQFKTPDIFINCSYPRTKDWNRNSFKAINLKSFQKNIDIHMNSFAWLARLSAESMLENNIGGSIIQLSSIYGIVGQDLTVYRGTNMQENMTYSLIKGGITNLTRQMASYYGKYNIRVNTLCPGGLEGHVAETNIKQEKIFLKNYKNKTPMGRLGKANEVASAALFLASEASSYITGTTLLVDGGWTIV